MVTFTELSQNKYPPADHSPKRGKDKFIRLQTAGVLAYSVDEFCHLVGIGRSSFYQLMNSGALRTVLIQRGSNENLNGLIRQYIPKARLLSTVSDAELAKIECLLNNRPRKRLGYKTPFEVFTELMKPVALRA